MCCQREEILLFGFDNWSGSGVFPQPKMFMSYLQLNEAWDGTCWDLNAIKRSSPTFNASRLMNKMLKLAVGKEDEFTWLKLSHSNYGGRRVIFILQLKSCQRNQVLSNLRFSS
ncbi:hypothetical protein ACH5RR_023616 [Cinchona calisaya]|uniref:Uncharacterized protein n=1 Tax=Cinchona calisaya TaxID=153742 RepID=A0ABD2ZCN9_9GENT